MIWLIRFHSPNYLFMIDAEPNQWMDQIECSHQSLISRPSSLTFGIHSYLCVNLPAINPVVTRIANQVSRERNALKWKSMAPTCKGNFLFISTLFSLGCWHSCHPRDQIAISDSPQIMKYWYLSSTADRFFAFQWSVKIASRICILVVIWFVDWFFDFNKILNIQEWYTDPFWQRLTRIAGIVWFRLLAFNRLWILFLEFEYQERDQPSLVNRLVAN